MAGCKEIAENVAVPANVPSTLPAPV
jgi:hypothetical protein